MKLTDNKGVDTAIEAVGTAVTFEICEAIVAAGGHLANIGVHGKALHSTWKPFGHTTSPSQPDLWIQ